jgi:hypothetical protein
MKMVRRQIEGPNTLIVAAGKTDQDDETDDGYYLAKEVDPSGDRTVRVHTMWGLSSQERKDKVISKIRDWSTTPSKQPHVVHLEPDSTKELVPAIAPEVPKECQGTTMMVQKLGGRLGSLVRAPATTNALKGQFEAAKKKVNEQIQALGPWSGDEKDIQKEANKLSFEHVEKPIKKMLPRILELEKVQELIQDLMGQCEEHSGNTVLEKDVDYWVIDKKELIIFQGQRVCKKIVSDKIGEWGQLLLRGVERKGDPVERFDAGIDRWLVEEGTGVLEVIKQKEEPNGPLPKAVLEEIEELWNQARVNINEKLKEELQSKIIHSFKESPCDMRDMSSEEMEKYLHPDSMAVLCEYIQMDAQGDECQDKKGPDSILKYLASRNPVLDASHPEKIIGCAICHEVEDKCKCDNREKWENCPCGGIQPCACGKVILDLELRSVLEHRRRVLTGAKEWIGFKIGSRPVGCLGRLEEKVRVICIETIKNYLEEFESTVPKNVTDLLKKTFGEDPNKEKREGLDNQKKAIDRGITYVEDLAGAA